MGKRIITGLLAVCSVQFGCAVSTPVEIFFTNGPKDGYNVIVPEPVVTNAYLIAEPIEPSRPKCNPQPQTPKVQYVLDYAIRLPCPPRKHSPTPRKPMNQVDRAALQTASPTTVRRKCICREPTVMASDVVVSCPLHPAQTISYSPNTMPYPSINLVSTNGQIIKSRRSKRELPKKKFLLKKPLFGKFLKSEKLKLLDAHKIHKRDVSQPEKRQVSSFQLKKQYKYPEIVQYFPEVLSTNYKPGECFTCCSTKKKGEIVCQPSGRSAQLVSKQTEVTYPGGYTSDYTSSVPVVGGYQGYVEVIGQDDSATDKAYRDYIKAVIHSHEDFIKAEGTQKELVVSEETQRSQAAEFIQKLIADQLARSREDDYNHREFRSAPIAILPSNTPPTDSSFLVKLTQPLSQPGSVVPPVKSSP